jgi:peptide/nickel transport system substrate-binding protein/oligopeptide transport system substrate-binding protein
MEHIRRKIVMLASFMALAILLSGCGLPWFTPQPTPEPKLPDAQQVFHPLASGPNAGAVDTLDPAQIQFGFDYGVAQLIFPQLVTLDAKQQPADWAAESHQISADGLTYTFHLHKGMTRADGTPIDATTFAYSISRALDPCIASGVSYYNLNIKGATDYNSKLCDASADGLDKTAATALIGKSIAVSDPLTLKVTLEAPAAYFLSEMSYPTFWGVPKQLVDKYGQAKWTDHVTDNGPFGGNLFLLQNNPTGLGSLIFERNERFWGKKPLLRRIEYTLYPNTSIAWPDFISGVGDSSAIPSMDLGASDATAIVTARTLAGVILQQVPSLAYRYLEVNWKIAPFDDVRVRQAFSLALDRQAIAHEIYLDTAQPTIHLLPEGMPGYNADLTDAAGRKGKDALTPALATARALLNAYAAEKCGGAWTACPTVILKVLTGTAAYLHLTAVMTNQWSGAFPGYPISTQTLDGVDVLWGCRRCLTGLPTLATGWIGDYPDPQDALSPLWTTQGEHNISSVSMPSVDALLAQADGMNDQAARIPLYQQAEHLLVDQGATIPLTQIVAWYAARSRVVGWSVAPTGVTPLHVWQTAYLGR